MPEPVEQQTAQGGQQQEDLSTMFVKAGEAAQEAQSQAATQQTAASSTPATSQSAAPETTTSAAATPAEITDALEAAKQLGVDVTKFRSPGELVRAMYSRLSEAIQYSQIGQRYAPHAREFDEFLASRQQAQQPDAKSPAQQPQQTKAADDEWNEDEIWQKAWNPPAYKPEWDRAIQLKAIEVGEDGLVHPASPEFAGMAQDANNYLIAKREWDASQRNENPRKAQWEAQKPVLERYVKQMLDTRLKEAFEDFTFKQEVGQWEQWLDQYSYDRDPITGQQAMNAWRQNFDNTLEYLKQRYPGSHYRTLLEDALAIVGQPQNGSAQTQQPAGAQQTVAQVSAQRKDDFLRGAQAIGPGERNTAIAASAVTDQPPSSEAELATMFLEAGRQLEARPR